MIVITGAAGFIGSCLVAALNEAGYADLILVDDFSIKNKVYNYFSKKYTEKIERIQFINWLHENHTHIQFIIHLGARTDTTEQNTGLLAELNTRYSQQIWISCIKYGLPLIYASSAATYGAGELGYSDDHAVPVKLKPLNPYGMSKNEFDIWALQYQDKPWFWAGLKFFNVYGPNEYHKGRMASVIYHTYRQITENGFVNLFKSHNPEYENGKQLRDFIYVKDVTDVIIFLMEQRPLSGIYNLGTGKARTFLDLATGVFNALNKTPTIEYIDTPVDIRDKYQYYTCADMKKLKNAGYIKEFTSLEDGISDYVNQYLVYGKYW